jgi:hypothetical protein
LTRVDFFLILEYIKKLRDMKYTAKQIDKMAIEELESLTYMLTAEQLIIWTGMGYDGATFVKLIK